MRHDTESAETSDVGDHVARFTPKRIWRLRKSESDVMPGLRAELDRIDDEHAITIPGRVWPACAVSVIGEDDEVQPGTRRSSRYLIRRS